MTRTQELLEKMKELEFDELANKLENMNKKWKDDGIEEY